MSSADDNSKIEDVADKAREYEGRLETFVLDRPLTAVAISVVFGALLARWVFARSTAPSRAER
jgi:ElaB/YqjD/DUF883 family membrane-anchored ribosome-binding protein